jgi:hypothetical protein
VSGLVKNGLVGGDAGSMSRGDDATCLSMDGIIIDEPEGKWR